MIKIILCCIFFLSGASALIFEALWFYLAGLALGNSVWAASITLSSFMGGLALGNGIAAFHGEKIRSPLRLYAILEFVIGISGLLIVIIFPYLFKILVPIFHIFSEHLFIINYLRAFFAITFLIIPSTAMGLTLPVLVRALHTEKTNFGETLGALYGWNTLGAVAGVLLCELILVKWFGIKGAGCVAAGFNFLAAIIALLLVEKIRTPANNTAKVGLFSLRAAISLKTSKILLASFLTGFIFLALEVVWFRFIILFYNGFSWNFATILAGVLAGIGLGGIFTSLLYKIKQDIHRYITVFFQIIAILVLLLYCNFDSVFSFTRTFPNEMSIVAAAALFLVFPIAFISGILFTMLGEILHSTIGAATNITGLLTLANTAGGMIGALAGGYFFLPVIGIENAFAVLSVLYIIAALLVMGSGMFQTTRGNISYLKIINCVTAAFFILTLAFFPFGLMERYYSYIPILSSIKSGAQRLALKEGVTETIQYVQEEIAGQRHYLRLITNNHAMSGTDLYSRRYMSLFVDLPVALHPDPKDALLICFGCGTTAKALTNTKSFETIDIVDISKDIVEMSRFVFPAPEDNPKNSPRVNIHIEDGRFFLLTTDRKYDLITAEPPPPKHNGVVNLYSQEYFQLIYDRLKDGGMVTYWLPIRLQTIKENKSILKAFCSVFPNSSLWTGAGYVWMIMGINNPGQATTYENFISQWNDPVVAKNMRAIGLFHPEQMGALFLADSQKLHDWIGGSLPLTDNFPKRLATSFALSGDIQDTRSYDEIMNPTTSHLSFIESDQIRRVWPPRLIEGSAQYFKQRGVIDALLNTANMDYKLLHKCISDPSLTNYIPWFFRSDSTAQQIISDLLKNKGVENIINQKTRSHIVAYYIVKKDYLTAERYWQGPNIARMTAEDYYAIRFYLLRMGGELERIESVKEEYINLKKNGREKRKKNVEKLWFEIDSLCKTYFDKI